MIKKTYTTNNFEQIDHAQEKQKTADSVAKIALKLGKVAMNFARVERKPRYEDGERETDVEHSYMLALVAPELAAELKLPLDHGKLSQYAIVHDLVELKTGDIATFSISDQKLAEKHAIEARAIDELSHELPSHTASLLLEYESQSDGEARFVRFIDKLLPLVVATIGQGERVMREDYKVHSSETLRKSHAELSARWERNFGNEFSDINLVHDILCGLFEQKFSDSTAER